MNPEDQQRYTERMTRLEEIFKPQVQNIEQQIAQLPSRYEAQKSALQQAKENAFRDITKTASRGGMLFTGFTPREEARYLGTTYLPGLQQLTQQENEARLGLLGQIANIQGTQRAAGLSYLDQLEAWRRSDEQARAARAAAASTGWGGFDFGGDTTPPPQVNAAKAQQDRQAIATLNASKALIDTNNRQVIKARVDQLKNLVSRSTGAQKQLFQFELDAITRYGKEKGLDVNNLKVGASRAQEFYNRPLVAGRSINRLTLTPGEAANQVRTNWQIAKNAYDYLFGAR